MALDLTSFDPALKEIYTQKYVENMVYKNNPLLALLPKDTTFVGDAKPMPIIYGNPSASGTFSDALADTTNSSLKKFVLTRVKKYSVAEIDNETLEASQSNAGAFISAAKTEIDGAMQAVTRRIAVNLYRTSGGAIGRLNGDPSGGTTATLDHYTQALNFEVGMKLEADTVDGGGTKHSGSVTLTAVDRSTATNALTASGNWDTGITSIADNDYLFAKGDYDACVSGLASWIPSSVTSTSFFGVDRTADPTRLGGQRVTGTGLPIEEALIKLARSIGQEGGKPDYCFMSFHQWENLVNSLGSKVQYDTVSVPNANVGFDAIKIYGPTGAIKVIPDQNCPSGVAYMLDMSTWKLCSLGGLPRILKQDGLTFLRSSSADSIQVRVGGYFQLGCMAPGWNGRVSLDN